MSKAIQIEQVVDAGPFGLWLKQMQASLQGNAGTEVPCGECRGCCVSSYFIPVRASDSRALTAIPIQFLVKAPNQPAGQMMMGYRDDGTCPMLAERECTIYQDRPQTCRDYDCRIFAAAGIDAGDDSKVVINNRVRAWRFSYESDLDRSSHDAVLAAAAFIKTKANCFPSGRAPTASTGIAVLAIKSYEVFLRADLRGVADQEIANEIIKSSRAFDSSVS
jgi:uncharacterized protein